MDYKDYYRILGVKKAADEKEIKRAYRKLARQYHPDKNPGNKQAEEKFKEINEAYEVLGDPDNRQKYDQLGSSYHHFRQMGGHAADFDFSQWFGGAGARRTGGYQSTVNLNDLFGNGRAYAHQPRSAFRSFGCPAGANHSPERQRAAADQPAEEFWRFIGKNKGACSHQFNGRTAPFVRTTVPLTVMLLLGDFCIPPKG